MPALRQSDAAPAIPNLPIPNLPIPDLPIPDLDQRSGCNALVRRFQGLAALTASDVAALERISAQLRLLGPQVDLRPDDAVPEAAFVVLEGFACRYTQRAGGRRQIMAYLLPGDLCDVDAPDPGPRTSGSMNHAVGTLATSRVARIPRPALTDLIRCHPTLGQALRAARLSEQAITREWIVNLGCRSALERMDHLFCEVMARFEAVGLVQDGACPLPLTQSDLGDTLGLSNVHVNRTLQDLRRQGLVELRGRSLRLLKPRHLRDIAEFSPGYLLAATGTDGPRLSADRRWR
ncbi:Crp/Fnr family transcriptional regulator [Methylobacterium sp. Leaf113]|uniref:Crp/Fnr family transcriptional regulator n=1 Tax=Methylobacterium sp. Leaf113 TaxID=1736259 RepID=UPI000A93ECCA|nr:Crp/Fnr family transcriptional regulator [Methylobacterium sp. Leaf113]